MRFLYLELGQWDPLHNKMVLHFIIFHMERLNGCISCKHVLPCTTEICDPSSILRLARKQNKNSVYDPNLVACRFSEKQKQCRYQKHKKVIQCRTLFQGSSYGSHHHQKKTLMHNYTSLIPPFQINWSSTFVLFQTSQYLTKSIENCDNIYNVK